MPRTILHLDLDAFFCAVEELRDPGLRGKAFAVGGRPEERGVVASCSYAARAMGVHSAMPMSQALRLCPSLLIVSSGRGRYSEKSGQVMNRLNNLAPLVEQISIDEAFVDISDIRAPAHQIAENLQRQIINELGLPCSVGVATNKLVAKIATETGKKANRAADSFGLPGYPCGLTIVPPGTEAQFLAGLPVSMLWGVGPKTEKRLAELGVHRIGELAALGENTLAGLFGENGRDLARHALGQDDRPVVTEHAAKSVSQETTFARDISDDHLLEDTLRELSASVGHSLRSENLAGTTIKLKLRWPDFTTLTRQATLASPTNLDEEIFHTARELLHKNREKGRPVRLIGVGLSKLGPPIRQMELWGQENEKARKLQEALDSLQARYGRKVVDRGR
jgi:DNA polymerase-4